METGIYEITNEAYHSGPGISKSGLWELWQRTPAHFMGAERKATKAKDFGTAAHTAILEPHLFEKAYCVAPPGSKNSNVYKDKALYLVNQGFTLLSQDEYDAVRWIRDEAERHPLVRTLRADAVMEQSAYWIDEETGELCRCRPDVYSRKHRLIGDIKTSRSADANSFARDVANYGYHVQEPFYSDGWQAAGGGDVDGFAFIVIEKEPPYLFAVYELDPDSVEEGRQIARTALKIYAECRKTNTWPGYADKVQQLSLPKWAFRFVNPTLEAAE